MWRTLITISCLSAAVPAEAEIVVVSKSDIVPDSAGTLYKCPKGFEREKRDCYYFSQGKANWNEADIYCKNLNSTLFQPSDASMDRQFRAYTSARSMNDSERWIGARYNLAKSAWAWGRTNEKISYNGFWRRQFFQKNMDWFCVVMNPKRSYHWTPRQCHRRRHYACHTPAATVPVKFDIPIFSEPGIANIPAAVPVKFHIPIFSEPGIADIPGGQENCSPESTDTEFVCPEGLEQEGEHCYYISKDTANWDEADAYCKNKNLTLFEPQNKQIDRRFRAYTSSRSREQVEYWIGAKYDQGRSAWIWGRTGEKVPFNGFYQRQFAWKVPNWSNCAVMNPKRSYHWAPRQCHRRRRYVCHTLAGNKPLDGYTLQTTDSPPPTINEITNEILEKTIDNGNEIPRNLGRRFVRKTRESTSGVEPGKESQESSDTRWAPGTKRNDRLRLMKSQDLDEPDQWGSVPGITAFTSQNEKIVPKEIREKLLVANYKTGPRTLAEEPVNTLFQLNRHLSSDLVKEEILLET